MSRSVWLIENASGEPVAVVRPGMQGEAVKSLAGRGGLMPSTPDKHWDELTEKGKATRRSERSRAEYGVSYPELCALVAVVARWRDGEQPTARVEIQDFIRDEEGFDAPLLESLARRGWLRAVKRKATRVHYVPTSMLLSKFSWLWQGAERGAAE